jgi:ribosome-binding ATPase
MSTSLSCGLVGLPNVGKSTVFNALTRNQVESSNYPFCTIDPNIGVVAVPDPRLSVIAEKSKSKKIVPAAMKFVDIAGLVRGASKGEGLGNKFLSNIREADSIIHVVRCFDDENVIHVSGDIDPLRDIAVINLELILADMQVAENILVKLEKQARTNKDLIPNLELVKKIRDHLNEEQAVRTLGLSDDEKELLAQYSFLTAKKVLYLSNIAEEGEEENPYVDQVREYAKQEESEFLPMCAKLEEEIAQLEEEESLEMLDALGLQESGLARLIRMSFSMLGLMTYLTAGEIETRAWTIVKGSTAVEAAGKIHTDIQKGFIRAEVFKYDDLVKYGGRTKAKEAGKVRAEGKNYIVQDGDIILFLHN